MPAKHKAAGTKDQLQSAQMLNPHYFSLDAEEHNKSAETSDLISAQSLARQHPFPFFLENAPAFRTPELLSICLGVHQLFFSWSIGEPRAIVLHMHNKGAGKCTSICKEIGYCTPNNSKKIERRKKDRNQVFVCSQCGTTNTPLWRKYNLSIVCNACGLYSRTHGGVMRPSRLFKDKLSPK
ncbi:hypothetical protein NEHOM01_1612 [Nematocida homosporus]|uniref:uncharacterized protein n=1 Tax=Nematocida homosporus TaxID=1912981 RepID=UPI0022204AE6|nr:uncharacterized protein NEHOM01_1612 [Nematocida homosporus]KAI5186659.1 hypothetical protein NEHOM01_1612 [Nematocida homosporus]